MTSHIFQPKFIFTPLPIFADTSEKGIEFLSFNGKLIFRKYVQVEAKGFMICYKSMKTLEITSCKEKETLGEQTNIAELISGLVLAHSKQCHSTGAGEYQEMNDALRIAEMLKGLCAALRYSTLPPS